MPHSNKKLSPKQISLYAASILAVSICLFSITLGRDWKMALLILGVSFVLAHLIFYFFIKKFLSQRLKLIYKFIYDTKAGRKEQFFYNKILPQKSIDQVENEVSQWAKKKSTEIEQLKVNEQFRKEFLNNLTHELRTPIFTAQGYIHTLLDGAIDDENVNRRFLQNASKGLDRLAHLASDLAQITELESRTIPLVLTDFDLKHLVSDVYEELMLKAEEKKIQLHFKAEEPGVYKVHADRDKIRQVLINIIENGIKYGKENGHVYTSFWDLDSDKVYLEVSDDGAGIEAEHLNRIFERFYRTDKSRSSKIPGTGLGLAIVKHIVEAHQQIVNVRSKMGVGSSFGFSLKKAED